MAELAANTPVIVGVGFYQNKSDDPADCPEPWRMMVAAIRDAAKDAGRPALVEQIQSLSVQQGMWQYRNPGHLVAEELGCAGAKSVLADLGVLQLTPLFDLFESIQRGEIEVGVVTGGEAKYRELRAKINGVEAPMTEQGEDTPPPDVYHPTPDPFATDVEMQAGIYMPTEFFAVVESALRKHRGLDVETHRDEIAQLYSGFSEVAANNPHAWYQQSVGADEIRNPVGKNAMLAFPYTKKHNSQWNVNQSVAILVCSLSKAQALGLDQSRWIYPAAAAQSRHVLCLAEQPTLHTHAGAVVAGERVYAMADIGPEDIVAADLYSCFPAAVQSFAQDLKLPGNCPWTVTGSMAFAGGPFNHAALDGVARMVEVLRGHAATPAYGLTTNLSGIFGKQAVALFSNAPQEAGYRYADVTDEVAELEQPLPTTNRYSGPATVVGYTVCYNKENISHGFVYCDTPDGSRTVARSEDPELLEEMTRREFVGETVIIGEGPTFKTA